MAKKKTPPQPYYRIAHDYEESFEAYKQASSMLYASVQNVLSLREHLKDRKADILLDALNEAAGKYQAAVYGDD